MAVNGLYVMRSKSAANSLRLSVKPCGKKARQPLWVVEQTR